MSALVNEALRKALHPVPPVERDSMTGLGVITLGRRSPPTRSPMPSTTDAVLLDANVLIALSITDHEHHDQARTWLGTARRFATRPSTQGSLVRFVIRVASTDHALAALELVISNERHEFWPDDVPYDPSVLRDVIGHRQVTGAYLAESARRHGAKVATFDRGLSLVRSDCVELIAAG